MASLSSIQRGSKTLSSGSGSMTIVRGTDTGFDSTVTAAGTILFITYRGGAGGEIRDCTLNWELTDGDTITVTRGATAGDIVVYWTLASFSSGVVVQHKSITLGTSSTSGTAAIDAASVGGGRWIISGGINAGGTNEGRAWGRWQIDSSTQISVTRQVADNSDSAVYKCQVVEWDDATVQTMGGTLSATTNLTEDITITEVDTAKTALWGTTDAPGTGIIEQTQWDLFLTSTTNLRLQRNDATSRTFNYTIFVVEFGASADVQTNAVALADGVGTANVTVSALTISESVAMLTGLGPVGMSSGRTDVASTAYQRHHASSELTSTTNHQVVRTTASNDQAYHSQVIQFSAAASGHALGGLAGGGGLAGPGGLAGRGGGLAG